MSLLMDALKRAEASKQEAARNLGAKAQPQPDAGLSLSPLADDAPKPAQTPLPDLSSHLAAVDAELANSAKQEVSSQPTPHRSPVPPAAAAPSSLEQQRDIARNAFAAKQEEPKPTKGLLWRALGTLGIAGVAIGGYVWYQLNTLNGPKQAISVYPTPAPMASAQTNPPSPLAPPPTSSPEPTPSPTDTTRLFTPPSTEPRVAPASPAQTWRPAPPEAPIRLTRTRPEPDGNLQQGHAAMQRNDLIQARQNFEKALQRDPNNTDALLALAAIAQTQGRPGEAEEFNQRALVANPSDPAVQGAVLNGTAAGADPQNTESRLKTLLAAQPESAPLNFALGNLYSRQQRWPEAQQAYFNAVAADGDNPDYLLNLAVSLDHMRQARPAAQHYRLALEAAERRPAAFDRPQVRRRLAELQPERQP